MSLSDLIAQYKAIKQQQEQLAIHEKEYEIAIMQELQKYPDKKWETANGDKFTAYEKKTPVTEKYLRDNYDEATLAPFKETVTKEVINTVKAVEMLGIESETKEMLKVTLK